MTSSQVAYTTVRLSAFNYHCLQLMRLVQRRSLQNNAYGYRQRYVYKQPWLIQLPFEYGEYGTRKYSLSTGWKKKHKSWAAVILIPNLRIYFNYLPYLHKLLITCDRFIHKASTCIFNLFYCKKTFTVKVSWKYCQHLVIILNSRCFIYLPWEWLCSFTSLPSPSHLVSCVDIALTCPFLLLCKERLHKEAMPK